MCHATAPGLTAHPTFELGLSNPKDFLSSFLKNNFEVSEHMFCYVDRLNSVQIEA
jgi:hypothetical protein